MHPSATVGEPVEGDGVGVAVAVRVLHRRRLAEGHHLPGLDALTGPITRVGCGDTNTATTIVGEACKSRSLTTKETKNFKKSRSVIK